MELREDSNAANGTTLPLPFRMEYRNTPGAGATFSCPWLRGHDLGTVGGPHQQTLSFRPRAFFGLETLRKGPGTSEEFGGTQSRAQTLASGGID